MAYVITGDAATNRANLGLGTAATLDVGSGANNIVQRDGSGKIDAAGLSGTLPALDGSALTGLDAGGVELIGYYTASTASSWVLQNIFPTGYKAYRVIMHLNPSTDSVDGYMRFLNGTSQYTNSYYKAYLGAAESYPSGVNNVQSRATYDSSQINFTPGGGNYASAGTAGGAHYDLTFHDMRNAARAPAVTGNYVCQRSGGDNLLVGYVGAYYRDNIDVDGIYLYFSSGNVYETSWAAVYGYKSS